MNAHVSSRSVPIWADVIGCYRQCFSSCASSCCGLQMLMCQICFSAMQNHRCPKFRLLWMKHAHRVTVVSCLNHAAERALVSDTGASKHHKARQDSPSKQARTADQESHPVRTPWLLTKPEFLPAYQKCHMCQSHDWSQLQAVSA